ncbi:terminase large subunit [Latilactobacillus sakei subsp. sakei]|uniref:terminase large subunit domain-containing protein n=1 Tax=Latilactobacillus sakei TaxID=1599 RepID=UPI002857E503|nr:terminase large subunit [Latilactobacillus sakei]MDR7924371.1 terminase large subunit [Latilactobacillus sakei subsp. sakei]
MIKQQYVTDYIKLYKTGKIKLNKERVMLIKYLEKYVLSDDSLYFNEKQINDCVNYGNKWFFPIQPFQKFLITFVFLYHKNNDRRYYKEFIWLMGRGAGKNGLISVVGNFLISELNGIRNYNGSIIANSEEQAMTSITEIKDVVDRNETLIKAFHATSTFIKSRKTNSMLKYRTSNGNTKDGLRDGFVIFDEIHQYPDNRNVKVHISGLGKKPNSRVFYIGSDGYVREGFLDNKKAIAMKVLNGEVKPDLMFPFICKLDDESQIDDSDNWEYANPMLSKPITGYAIDLFEEIKEDYDALLIDPSGREEFVTKRMNLPLDDLERSVAPYEQIKATNRELPDLVGKECIGSVDFASVRDFIGCALTFKDKDTYPSLFHSYAMKPFVDKYYGYSRKDARDLKKVVAPIAEWVDRGDLEIMDGGTVDIDRIVQWFVDQRDDYLIKKIVIDNYLAMTLRKKFEEAGFEVDVIKRPTSIHPLLAPIVELGFEHNQFIWGDVPIMRWYTQNTLVKIDRQGNKTYEKKEDIRRKTDGFQAFLYTLYKIDEIEDIDISGALDNFAELDF